MFASWRCLRFGALLLAPLQSAVCRVLLQGAAVRVLFVLWILVAGAAAGCWCCFKVLLSECCLCCGAWLLVPLRGAAAGCRFRCPRFFLLFGVSANRVLAKPCRYTRFHCVRKTGLKGHLPRASVIGQNNGGNVRRNGGNQQKNVENFRFFCH